MKKIAIMQPYFFPYIGYFSLIKHTDEFILFDPVQFIRHGWIERNRVLKQDSGWLYVKAAIEKPKQETLIKNVVLRNDEPWREKILAQLQIYKKTAPYYNQTIEVVSRALDVECENITSLNKHILKTICNYLGFDREFPIFSEMNLTIDTPTAPDEWALNICRAFGDVSEYWNPPGGMEFFSKDKYTKAGLDLKFQKPILEKYDQKRDVFEGGLSIIDVMMFNSPEEINKMLDKFELE